MINVGVERGNNENSISIIKRFTRRVQGSGVLMRVRKNRYSERSPSEYTKKKHALKRLGRQQKVAELIKLGKLPEKNFR